jgi:uncharacterized protein (DUF427 family)
MGMTSSEVTCPRESVWDYPRPPRVEPCDRHVRVELGGEAIAESDRALRVLETSSPPTIYVPLSDARDGALRAVKGTTECEWKGTASYFDAISGDRVRPRAAWTYREPKPGYESLRDHVAFYAGRVDACYLDDERVTPQAGDFYGGWITAEIEGPFKGEPGTSDW